MTATQRRLGFRLKWSPEGDPVEEEQRAETDMTERAESGVFRTAGGWEPARPVEPSDQFLDSLTAAMRRVADDARETSLADARAAVAAKIADMRVAAGSRAEELRTRAEQDTTGVGDWSRAEIVRIEAETQRKIEQRRAQLAEQLDEHDRKAASDIAALEAQVEQYEGELALFFSQLGEISDPDTFIAAARRMPRLPQSNGEAAPDGEAATDAVADEATGGHEERLRSLGIDRDPEPDLADGDGGPTNGVEPESEAVASDGPAPVAEVAPASPVATAADQPVTAPSAAPSEPVTTDASTLVAAVGLGSFGAVTSFKTALEKAEGVTNVRLSLGSGGEFMYNVTHRADVDLTALIIAAHPGASVQRDDDGVLHLSAGKRR
ncbi:MAG: hypothetical protein M3537_04155 [Chloroflexota bacterium]|nr:hypothetical protein [Chloroflexota bacterium]